MVRFRVGVFSFGGEELKKIALGFDYRRFYHFSDIQTNANTIRKIIAAHGLILSLSPQTTKKEIAKEINPYPSKTAAAPEAILSSPSQEPGLATLTVRPTSTSEATAQSTSSQRYAFTAPWGTSLTALLQVGQGTDCPIPSAGKARLCPQWGQLIFRSSASLIPRIKALRGQCVKVIVRAQSHTGVIRSG
jgi:hypothetical protein